ncbi:hypothetical protein [Leucobacter sp. NPDC077196]|uniref:hypothetical protein n=1 Tax=Leucobacter sp. NPDC077196 TaxID=3154959 RepID=UPI003434F865
MASRAPYETYELKRARTAFWTYVGIGVGVMTVAWTWMGFATLEEITEQGKAEAAGTTMAGFAALIGGVPLVVAHLIGLSLLLRAGWRWWRGEGLICGLGATAVVSLIGFGVAQILFGGQVLAR